MKLDPAKAKALRDIDHLNDEEGNKLAMTFWPHHIRGMEIPMQDKPFVALAGMHRARIVWKGSDREMKKRSIAWLIGHGYEV